VKKVFSHPKLAPAIAAALLLLTSRLTEAVEPVMPGAGSILQSVQPPGLPQPSPSGTGLLLDNKPSAPLPTSAPFRITTIKIIGNSVFPAGLLHDLVKDAEGKELTLAQVGELAERLTDYLHSHNYPLTRAIVPAQTIEAGVVTLEVIEARYGQVLINNKGGVSDALLSATLSPLGPNELIAQDKLDRALLLLSDIPGMSVESNMQPGQTFGTTDLIVNTASLPMVTGNAALDNSGNRYTGQERVSANVKITNPLDHGDVLSATVLSSGRGMAYGQLSYETLLNGLGTRVGGSGSNLRYVLGDSLSAIDGHGSANAASLWVKQPLVRSQRQNVYAQLQVDGLWLNDIVDTAKTQKDRKLLSTSISLNGDLRDLVPQGLTSWKASVSSGKVSFLDRDAQDADRDTAQTQGNFVKYNVWANHLHNLTARNSLYVALSGQTAKTNLDQSQKMTVGGPNSVRAYDTGAMSGDNGALVTVELRHLLDGPVWGTEGLWQVMAFVDSARLTINKSPWVSGINQATLSGGGIGLVWVGAKQFTVQLALAERIGKVPALITNSPKVHGWAVVSKVF
jgi:hemolysin activation/secretion protein